MNIPPTITSPIVGAIAGEAIGEAISGGDTARRIDHLTKTIECMHKDMHAMSQYFRALYEPDFQQTINVPAAGQPGLALSRHGKRYMMLLVPPGTTNTAITFKIPGVGSLAFTLSGGWNELDLPEQTEIMMTTATAPVLMLYLCSNTPRGVTLVSVA